MELRCFMVHPGDPSVSSPYVEVSPPSSNGHFTKARVLGRHSPELYWRLGNDPRCSRQMFSVALVAVSGDEALAGCVHPQLAQSLVLRCLGKNSITVSRAVAGGRLNNTPNGEGYIVLHRNESTILRVGDRVGVRDGVWLQVVVARVCVSSVTREPVVVLPQNAGGEEGEGEEENIPHLPVSAGGVLCHRMQHPYLVPVVRVGQPWPKLPFSLRSVLVSSVWKCQQAAGSRSPITAAVSAGVTPASGRCTPGFVSHEVTDAIEEDAAASGDCIQLSLQAPGDGGSPTTCSEARSKRRQRGSSSGSRGVGSQLISLDAAPPQKKRRASVGGSGDDGEGAVTGVLPATCLAENNTYYDTYDEHLDEALCVLEKRVAVTDRLMTSWAQAPVVLGDSPPPEGRTGQCEKALSRGKSVTVSRTQLRLDNRQQQQKQQHLQRQEQQQQQQQQQLPGNAGPITLNPAGDESQVVYYRH